MLFQSTKSGPAAVAHCGELGQIEILASSHAGGGGKVGEGHGEVEAHLVGSFGRAEEGRRQRRRMKQQQQWRVDSGGGYAGASIWEAEEEAAAHRLGVVLGFQAVTAQGRR